MEGFDEGKKEHGKCELFQEAYKKGYQTKELKEWGVGGALGRASKRKKKHNESSCFSLLIREERQGYPSEENLMIVDEGENIMA